MGNAVPLHHLEESQPDDAAIEGEGAPAQVFRIQGHLLGNGQLVPPVHLGPAGEAGHQLMDAGLGAQGDQVVLVVPTSPRN